jgi:DNA-binding response OmpR family regulator
MARTILVVEDEPTLRETIVDALESDGFRVISAADGREALAQFRGESPDLVLLDLMLPELSGIEVTRIIRAESGVPIVMLTAKDSELDKVVGLELGADDYITKPFSIREFRSRVRAQLRRAQLPPVAARADVIEVDGVRIDVVRRIVAVRGEPVQLTFLEFELLHTLAANPGRVYSRQALLEMLRGGADYRDPRTIDVHVRHLREKIERDPGDPEYIFTVRGVGYRFREAT